MYPNKPKEILPDSQFNNYRILYELPARGPRHRRKRWFKCECDCGRKVDVTISVLGKTKTCSSCQSKYSHLYDQVPGCKRSITKSHPYEFWFRIRAKEAEWDVPVCQEWQDFEVFLNFYLQATGLSLEDVLLGRNGPSFFHAQRIDKDIGWQPDNTTFERFVTERARHKPTYQYWWTLKTREILSEELLSYTEFVNIFGTKSRDFYLARHDITKLHSKENSYWNKHARRHSRS
jgi:hypothetical protein